MKFSPYELTRFLRETGLQVKQTSRSWVLECPRCTKWKLYLLKSSGRFVCWSCGEQSFYGSAEYALAEILHKPPDIIRANLLNNEFTTYINLVGLDPDYEETEQEEIVEEVFVMPWDFYPIDHKHSERGRNYLDGRGIGIDLARKYNIRYCPPKRSVVFPILEQGRLLGWQERITYPHEYVLPNGKKYTIPKSPTAPGCEKANLLMFSDNLIGSDHCVLAEGPISAIKADLCGGAVCTMGKSISRNQMELLVNWAYSSSTRKKLYLALDPDAFQQTNQLVKDYYPYFDLYDMVPPGGDLGDRSLEENLDLFLGAKKITPGQIFVYLKG